MAVIIPPKKQLFYIRAAKNNFIKVPEQAKRVEGLPFTKTPRHLKSGGVFLVHINLKFKQLVRKVS